MKRRRNDVVSEGENAVDAVRRKRLLANKMMMSSAQRRKRISKTEQKKS